LSAMSNTIDLSQATYEAYLERELRSEYPRNLLHSLLHSADLCI
jgi:hypothetical protein